MEPSSDSCAGIRMVHGVAVRGLDVDGETRCRHYHGPRDVIALRMKCCGEWFPCIECHAACTDHAPRAWPTADRQEQAVLCGVCGQRLTIGAYLTGGSACPACGTGFNPGCARHHDLYFEPDP